MAEKNKNWFRRHWVLSTILGLLLFFTLAGIFSVTQGPTDINEVNENQETKVTSSNYVIEITGTSGLEFSGSIGGGGNSKTVEGSIPANYEISDWPAVAVIQKKGTSGTLTVTIKKNGRVLNTQTTNADYGVVSVTS